MTDREQIEFEWALNALNALYLELPPQVASDLIPRMKKIIEKAFDRDSLSIAEIARLEGKTAAEVFITEIEKYGFEFNSSSPVFEPPGSCYCSLPTPRKENHIFVLVGDEEVSIYYSERFRIKCVSYDLITPRLIAGVAGGNHD